MCSNLNYNLNLKTQNVGCQISKILEYTLSYVKKIGSKTQLHKNIYLRVSQENQQLVEIPVSKMTVTSGRALFQWVT